MKVVIVAGGPAEELPDFSLWADYVYIGVDAGAALLIEREIELSAAVGDFDSVTEKEMVRIKEYFPDLKAATAEKDETDTELALEKAMSYQPDTVIITGVTGGRLDHYMSALHAIYAYHLKYAGTEFLLINKQNRIRFLQAGKHKLQRDARYRFISFYPFAGEVKGFNLEGFKYEVAEEPISFGSTRFISNELEDKGIVSFIEGNCIMIESADG